MEHYQQAALSLHAMHASDRQWLLDRLPVSQRSRLASMLDELEQLGVPREPVLLDEVSGEPPAPPVHPLAERLREHDARNLCHALESEPDVVAVALLGRAGPWKRDVLAGMPPARRAAIEEAVDRASPLPDRTYEALCDATLRCLELTAPGRTAAAGKPTARRRRWLEKLPWRR